MVAAILFITFAILLLIGAPIAVCLGISSVAALGVIIVPAMITPSLTFVVYGSIADTSIGGLFIAGLLPGIIMGIGLMIVALVVGRKSDLKTLPKASKKERWAAFKDAFWGLMMPVIILGGIYGGIFTPTEAAAVSVVYGLFVGVFIYKKIRFKEFYAILTDTTSTTATVMFITMEASLFAYVLTRRRHDQQRTAPGRQDPDRGGDG